MALLYLGCCPPTPAGVPQKLAEAQTFPELPAFIWQPLMKTFEQQARGIPLPQWQALAAKYLNKTTMPVRVAVVDFAPNTDGPARSPHTEAVTGVIRSLLCATPEAPECRARVVPTRGVGVTLPELRTTDGKPARREYSFLSFVELATALREVIDQWQPQQEHLIVNLAVAWDPIKTVAGKTPLDDPKAQPIFQLINRASCLGALVIAPAGNVTGSEGPMFPAGYEVRSVPTDEQCAQMGWPRKNPISREQARLVYAVGALDSLDQRMVTVRHLGQPSRAAYALSVTATRAMNAAPYIFHGTSMAAAIVSGVAGAVWWARPDLRPEEVMTAVYEGGIRLDDGLALPERKDDNGYLPARAFDAKQGRTDFCLGHPRGPCAEPVRRVFLCGALQKVLPVDAGLTCADKPSQISFLPVLPKELIRQDANHAEQCTVTACRHNLGPSIDQIPEGAVPQPGIAGCPGCTLSVRGKYMYGSLTWDSATPPLMVSSVVQTWTDSWSDPAFTMTGWNVTQSFFRWVAAPDDTWGAQLTVSYQDENGNPQSKALPLNISWW